MEYGYVNYPQYIQSHMNAVRIAFYHLKGIGAFAGFSDEEIDKAERKVLKHDHSKMSDEEWDAYDAYFYGTNRSWDVVEEFERAWLHHIHENKHHWQHWVLIPDGGDRELRAIEIPDCYIIEMICDWASFGVSHGNLSEVVNWYIEHKDGIIMHEASRSKLEGILDIVKDKAVG